MNGHHRRYRQHKHHDRLIPRRQDRQRSSLRPRRRGDDQPAGGWWTRGTTTTTTTSARRRRRRAQQQRPESNERQRRTWNAALLLQQLAVPIQPVIVTRTEKRFDAGAFTVTLSVALLPSWRRISPDGGIGVRMMAGATLNRPKSRRGGRTHAGPGKFRELCTGRLELAVEKIVKQETNWTTEQDDESVGIQTRYRTARRSGRRIGHRIGCQTAQRGAAQRRQAGDTRALVVSRPMPAEEEIPVPNGDTRAWFPAMLEPTISAGAPGRA